MMNTKVKKRQKKLKHLQHSLKQKARDERTRITESLSSSAFISRAIFILILVLIQYVFSIGLTFYQKWFIKRFNFPFSVVICHLVVKYILAAAVRLAYEFYTGKERIVLGWRDYCKRLAPTGFASALDIGLSNWSFEFITISLYTMTKSTCIIFILIFSILLKIEKLRCSIVAIVVLISGGLVLFTYHATEFNLTGFLLVLSASATCGLRWTLAQLVTQKKEIGLHNPVDMVYHVQPWMIILLLPLAIVFESTDVVSSAALFRYHSLSTALHSLALVLLGAGIAFLMELSEYLVLVNTSALTQSITGIVKEIVTLVLAHFINGDTLSGVNVFGLFVCISGICLHVILKAIRMKEEARDRAEDASCRQILLPLHASVDYDDDEEEEEDDVLYERRR